MMAKTCDLRSWKGLSEQQVRGTACVWCGVILDNRTAVNLGQRPLHRLDLVVSWFPRACPSCGKDGGKS
ncbi:hypothetical protein [Streptomyces sp. NPDC002851]